MRSLVRCSPASTCSSTRIKFVERHAREKSEPAQIYGQDRHLVPAERARRRKQRAVSPENDQQIDPGAQRISRQHWLAADRGNPVRLLVDEDARSSVRAATDQRRHDGGHKVAHGLQIMPAERIIGLDAHSYSTRAAARGENTPDFLPRRSDGWAARPQFRGPTSAAAVTHALDCFLVQRCVADDPALADVPLFQLELRLDQNQEIGAGRGNRQRLPAKSCVTEMNDTSITIRLGDSPMSSARRYRAFRSTLHDARILPQLPIELVDGHVDRVYLARAALQQAIGESARRAADIEANPVARIDAEILERAFELQPAAARVAQRLADDLNPRIGWPLDSRPSPSSRRSRALARRAKSPARARAKAPARVRRAARPAALFPASASYGAIRCLVGSALECARKVRLDCARHYDRRATRNSASWRRREACVRRNDRARRALSLRVPPQSRAIFRARRAPDKSPSAAPDPFLQFSRARQTIPPRRADRRPPETPSRCFRRNAAAARRRHRSAPPAIAPATIDARISAAVFDR